MPFSKTGAELLFEVTSRAYERQSLIITTNLPFEAWIEILGNEWLTGALLDRFTHRIHIVEGMGHSLSVGAWPQIIDAIATHIQEAAGH